ncbi:DUF4339 domain-containing protein [Variovorax terrae]|uniref:DUF4339 domain-containing protein n=1 Tax=Variovorax terrae TaxID=2923278 RepID=A0A9X2APH0_9BURK|nr:DUF4339 domain-containing protein [Variovorax terrae]MCJ0765364.1 DUF4339 domain-containing protein [Variovorax terrae]
MQEHIEDTQASPEDTWFYEENGQRKGPVSEAGIVQLIKTSVLSKGSSVWKQGSPDWSRVEDTALRVHFDDSTPPPLSGEHIDNTVVWVLAFAPLIGAVLEYVVAGIVHRGNQYAAQSAMDSNKYWFVTVGLNIALAYFDEKRLVAAGHNTDKFKGWTWLVPVYLYQRSKATKQNLAYFIVWIACFVLMLLG